MDEFRALFGPQLAIAVLFLFIFGYFYNSFVEHLQKKTQSYTAELVVIGVLVTVLTSGFFIGWPAVVVLLVLFCASGCWMIIGSWLRHAEDTERAKEETRNSMNSNNGN